jgi:hypothetical protein
VALVSKGLTRRALFALPVALPVAAAVSAVAAIAPAPRRWIVISEELHVGRGIRSFKLLREVPAPWVKSVGYDTLLDPPLFRSSWAPTKFSDAELAATLGIEPPEPVVIGVDAGGLNDRFAIHVTTTSEAT